MYTNFDAIAAWHSQNARVAPQITCGAQKLAARTIYLVKACIVMRQVNMLQQESHAVQCLILQRPTSRSEWSHKGYDQIVVQTSLGMDTCYI